MALFAIFGVVAEVHVRPKLHKLKRDLLIDEDDNPPTRIGLITTIVIIAIITVAICSCFGVAISAMIRA